MKTIIIKKITSAFKDARGEIIDILDDAIIQHIGVITSKAGTVRANHYHIKQTQHNYILSGRVKLTTWDVNEKSKPVQNILVQGDIVFIPAGVAHRMEFLEDTVFLDFNSESRSNDGYEKDTVRVKYDPSL